MKIESLNNGYIDFNIFANKIIVSINNKNELFELNEGDKMLNKLNDLFTDKSIKYIKQHLIVNGIIFKSNATKLKVKKKVNINDNQLTLF